MEKIQKHEERKMHIMTYFYQGVCIGQVRSRQLQKKYQNLG
jgi:hypothetical protein